ncbi:MAG: hypothetical protein HY073_00965 [Deltaproteobacteria bacterium]|nr:hypothetical protein [Deltaproteobacteria bacterium]
MLIVLWILLPGGLLAQNTSPAKADLFSFVSHRSDPAIPDIQKYISESLNVYEATKYQASLVNLQKHGKEAVQILADEYKVTPTESYFERWLLVHTMAQIEDPSNLNHFRKLLMSPIPPEKSQDTHHFSTVEQEVVIRLATLNGSEVLAQKGNAQAKALLLETIKANRHPVLTREAVVAYMASAPDEDEAKKELRSVLPADSKSLIELKRLSWDQIPKGTGPILKRAEEGQR